MVSASRTFVALTALVCALVLVPAGAVSAHDQLIESSPASGERVATAPSQVVLRYSNDVMTIGAIVMVVDATGQDWASDQWPDPVHSW